VKQQIEARYRSVLGDRQFDSFMDALDRLRNREAG
jgi:hypothetical protein